MREPTIVIPDTLLERMAKAGFEDFVRRREGIIEPGVRTWGNQTEALHEDWLAIARAMQQSLGETESNLAATASNDGEGRRRPAMLLIACAVALALLGASGVALWTAGWRGFPSVTGLGHATPAISKAAPIEPDAHHPRAEASAASGAAPDEAARTHDARGTDRPSPAISNATPIEPDAHRAGAESATASGAGPEVTTPTPDTPAQEPAVSSPPSHSAAGSSELAASTAERREPRNTTCTVVIDPWPPDGTGQAKAIQILLRELGFYSGTTYGTVGPATRAAIRKFQLAANEAETGEPSEMLFESLKKKKCASTAP